VKVEAADADDEQISDDEIEEAPEGVDRRGGKALTGRLGERGLEGMAGDSVTEMRDCVGEESAAEEIRDVIVPVHEGSLPGWRLKDRSILEPV
jgi:hypothetical protein